MKKVLLAILAVLVVAGAGIGGYFIGANSHPRGEDVSGKSYYFNHQVEVRWAEGTTQEKKSSLLDGGTEEELINNYKSLYKQIDVIFNENGTAKVQTKAEGMEDTTSDLYWTQSLDKSKVELWKESEHTSLILLFEFVDGSLCFNALATTGGSLELKEYLTVYFVFKEYKAANN